MPLEERRVTYLSPTDDAEAAVLAAAQSARASLHVLCYALTDVQLIASLLTHHKNGLDVGVVVDSTQAAGTTQHPLMQQLVDAGVPVTISRSPKGGILHHKVLLVDVAALGTAHGESFVCHGSFNLTGATAESQGNVLITDNDAALCAYYWRAYQEFETFGKLHVKQLTPTGAETAPAAPGVPQEAETPS